MFTLWHTSLSLRSESEAKSLLSSLGIAIMGNGDPDCWIIFNFFALSALRNLNSFVTIL